LDPNIPRLSAAARAILQFLGCAVNADQRRPVSATDPMEDPAHPAGTVTLVSSRKSPSRTGLFVVKNRMSRSRDWMIDEMTALPAVPVAIENVSAKPPLCVDLDGTLVRADTLLEQVLVLLLSAPWRVFKLLRWVFSGKAHFKSQVGCYAALDPSLLPYDERVLGFLRQEKNRGRMIVLVTAADRRIAEVIANHLGLFNRVLASDGFTNLKGSAKAEVLKSEFGSNFTYMGNDYADLAVWAVADTAVVANAPRSLVERVRRINNVELVFPPASQQSSTLIKAVRPHQWSKNLLLFVPIITANAFFDTRAWLAAAIAFLAFCAMASSVYILNDLTDLAADRRHPRKRQRPLASGALSIPAALALVIAMVACSAALSWSSGLFPLILIYAGISLLYTLKFKELLLVDVFTLAFLYSIRLFGGGHVTGYTISLWLLGFSTFLFLALAVMKRVSELISAHASGRHRLARRAYRAEDLVFLQVMGIASSFSATVLLALYVQSSEVTIRYQQPAILWAFVPLALFWQCRLWLSTTRGSMHDDPIVYAAQDWVSWLISAAVALVIIIAKYPFFAY
jgi:4-hydroxybenzoate polyprenyltransferase